MALQSYATLDDLATWLRMTVEQVLEAYPNAQKLLDQISLELTGWIFPNCAKGHEDCLRQASLYQWDYMHSDMYQAATLPSNIIGFSVMSFHVESGGNDGSDKYGVEYNRMAPLARTALRNCGLLCRATCCGVAPC